MNIKRLEISNIYAKGGWNGSYGHYIEISLPNSFRGYEIVRMDLTDLLVFLEKTNPEYEIIEPKGSRKYTYIRPIPKGGEK